MTPWSRRLRALSALVMSGELLLSRQALADPGDASQEPMVTTGWIVAGTGLAALSGGVVLQVVARGRLEDARQRENAGELVSRADWDAARRFARPGAILSVVGLTALATGVVLVLVAPDSAGAGASVQIAGGLDGVTLGGRF